MIKLFLIILICFVELNADIKNEDKFIKLFSYLENNNIIIGKDISTKKLYKIINNNELYLKNGELNTKVINNQLVTMLDKKSDYFKNIKKEIDKNPNSKVNKEIKYFIDDSNERIENTQKNLKENDTDGWFSNITNYVLDFMKN